MTVATAPQRAIDILGLEHVVNTRTYHHLRTTSGRYLRPHKIIRGGRLTEATTHDVQQLEALDVTAVVDLRLPNEAGQNPDVKLSGVQYVAAPLFVGDLKMESDALRDYVIHHEDGPEHIRRGYQDLVAKPELQESLRQFLVTAVNTPGAVMFHCSAGKDRTGTAAALLLGALGVPRDVIRRDYLLSNHEQAAVINQTLVAFAQMGATRRMLQDMRDMTGVRVDYLDTALDWVDQHYGNVRNYVGELLGNGAAGLAALDHAYLEDEANN
ncbi:tyrosine-protein phosphatase [Lacticaseibacillus thailandensis]|uniref:tyrosine-protein phosphatase n=1 Tax=Lacticaseibacillus thailandensis TaxID=381741 RepID=UPI000704AF92|nr:tyrosine-protein phosphatase [Lacticaseibacillus thailandensis]